MDAPEQRHRLVIPTPPHVVGQVLQGLQAFRQMGQDGERTDGAASHDELGFNQVSPGMREVHPFMGTVAQPTPGVNPGVSNSYTNWPRKDSQRWQHSGIRRNAN